MNKKLSIIGGIACSVIVLTSCGGGASFKEGYEDGYNGKEASEHHEEAKVETCSYSYVNDSTKAHWTAYKHTAKVGVHGMFEQIAVEGAGSGATAAEVIKGMSFSIPVGSINSNNEKRDGKLVKIFFGAMTDTENITGTVKSVEENKAVVSMKMNGVEKDVTFDLIQEDTKVELRAEINVEEWEAQKSLEDLGVACEAKHTGADGVKKLWPDVSILISTVLNKECK